MKGFVHQPHIRMVDPQGVEDEADYLLVLLPQVGRQHLYADSVLRRLEPVEGDQVVVGVGHLEADKGPHLEAFRPGKADRLQDGSLGPDRSLEEVGLHKGQNRLAIGHQGVDGGLAHHLLVVQHLDQPVDGPGVLVAGEGGGRLGPDRLVPVAQFGEGLLGVHLQAIHLGQDLVLAVLQGGVARAQGVALGVQGPDRLDLIEVDPPFHDHLLQTAPVVAAEDKGLHDPPQREQEGDGGQVLGVYHRFEQNHEQGPGEHADLAHGAPDKGSGPEHQIARDDAEQDLGHGAVDGTLNQAGHELARRGHVDIEEDGEQGEEDGEVDGKGQGGVGQSDPGIEASHNKEHDERDQGHAAPEKAQEADEGLLGGEGVVGDDAELIGEYGQDHAGHQPDHNQEPDYRIFLDQPGQLGQLPPRGFGLGLLGGGALQPPFARFGQEQGQDKAGAPEDEEGGVLADKAGYGLGGEIAQGGGQNLGRGDQGKDPLALPGVEKVAGNVPEVEQED